MGNREARNRVAMHAYSSLPPARLGQSLILRRPDQSRDDLNSCSARSVNPFEVRVFVSPPKTHHFCRSGFNVVHLTSESGN